MNEPPGIDAAFRNRIIRAFHEDGAAWLDALPDLLNDCAARWNLTLGQPFTPLSYNYVIAATRADGTDAVLKLGVPRPDLRFEIDALRHYDGDAAIRVFDADPASGVSLLERAIPGDPIVLLDDDEEATRIAAGIMRRLWRAPAAGHSLPTVASWGSAYAELRARVADWGSAYAGLRARNAGGSGQIPAPLFDYAESLYFSLDASRERDVVLHGDLHHWNIVRAQREPWLAIDPHGLVGDPGFEVGSWMRNPVGDEDHPDAARLLVRRPDLSAVLARRLDIFSDELALPRERLRDWALAFAILSACWSDESNDAPGRDQAVLIAQHLRNL
jgi:streptomycin 6-kinase